MKRHESEPPETQFRRLNALEIQTIGQGHSITTLL